MKKIILSFILFIFGISFVYVDTNDKVYWKLSDESLVHYLNENNYNNAEESITKVVFDNTLESNNTYTSCENTYEISSKSKSV